MTDFIEVYSDAYSKEYCEELIDYFEQMNKLQLTYTRQQTEIDLSKNNKEDDALYLPSSLRVSEGKAINHFFEVFWKKFEHYEEEYLRKKNRPYASYNIKLQRTREGQGYHTWHFENAGNSNRVCAFSLYLNDNFDAGETEFLFQHKRIEPKQGDLLIFPAYYTHTHRGNPPIGGTKYIVTGWVEFG